MALIFPWATKEYLLWNMTIGQIVMYHNKAIEIQNGKQPSSYANKSAGELKRIRDTILNDVEKVSEKERQVQEMRRKYGDV